MRAEPCKDTSITRSGPVPSSPAVSMRMSGVGHRATGPELALRKRLHAAGFRYRVQFPIPDRPRRTIDIAFPRWRVAVFVDGCFWHSCPEHRTEPNANHEWWLNKLRSNVDRDLDTDEILRSSGWTVVRVWEHETAEQGYKEVVAALRATGYPTGMGRDIDA